VTSSSRTPLGDDYYSTGIGDDYYYYRFKIV